MPRAPLKLSIASPCAASWDDMKGDERIRFCGACQKNVYNLRGYSLEEARRLVERDQGTLCVRIFARPDGTVLTKDCPVGWRRVRQRLVASVAAAACLALGLVAGALAGLFDKHAPGAEGVLGRTFGRAQVWLLPPPPPSPILMNKGLVRSSQDYEAVEDVRGL
ncbi:MAG: hypothetical protein K1X89_21685 [Myxococcaceae bacterium]|nr:hypothetical protein [Myxococcaceae bacterium]